MDIAKQKKLEPLRLCVPILGGSYMVWRSFHIMSDADLSRVVGLLPFIVGLLLIGVGVGGMKFRRLLFSYEERLQQMEQSISELERRKS